MKPDDLWTYNLKLFLDEQLIQAALLCYKYAHGAEHVLQDTEAPMMKQKKAEVRCKGWIDKMYQIVGMLEVKPNGKELTQALRIALNKAYPSIANLEGMS